MTSQFTDDSGSIDLLSRAGLDPRGARRTMRFSARDLSESTERDALIQQLARVDQDQLWVAAEALRTWCRVTGESRDDGERVTMRINFDDAGEARFIVLGLGAGVDVIAPAELRERIAATITEMFARVQARDRA